MRSSAQSFIGGRNREEVRSFLHTDHRQTKLNCNLAWAKTYLKRVGAVDNSARGVWSLTDVGEQMTPVEVERVPALVRRQDSDRKRLRDNGSDRLIEESVASGSLSPEESWKDMLLSALRDMSPDAFERLAQRLLREAGFVKGEVTGRSGDGGIDGVGVLRVNLLSFQVLFQCKRYQGTVGAGAVRDFRGAMVGRTDRATQIQSARSWRRSRL